MKRQTYFLFFALVAVKASKPDPWWSGIHERMTSTQLAFYFEASESGRVNPASYEVTSIVKRNVDKRDGSIGITDTESVVLSAFGKIFDLNGMTPNHDLLAPHAKVFSKHASNTTRRISVSRSVSRCRHFTYSQGRLKGGLSRCRTGEYRGFLMDGDDVYDIAPIDKKLRPENNGLTQLRPHLVRMSTFSSILKRSGLDASIGDTTNWASEVHKVQKKGEGEVKKRAGESNLVVEVFVVVDPEAANAYLDFYDDDQKVIELALVIMNGIQGRNTTKLYIIIMKFRAEYG
jgi:hypothetical protein